MAPKTLTAFYDFAVSPLSYDFVYFLCMTRIANRILRCDRFHVVFVPADTETGFRIDHKPTTVGERLWRRDNLLAPMCRLIDASYTICATRGDASRYIGRDIWPASYRLNNPSAAYFYVKLRAMAERDTMPPFRVEPWARQLVTQWIGERKYLTITHRRTYGEVRNSNSDAWAQFSEYAQGRGWIIVNIPDTEDAGIPSTEPLGAIAAINPLVRHALYVGAEMNLGVNTGPMATLPLRGASLSDVQDGGRLSLDHAGIFRWHWPARWLSASVGQSGQSTASLVGR